MLLNWPCQLEARSCLAHFVQNQGMQGWGQGWRDPNCPFSASVSCKGVALLLPACWGIAPCFARCSATGTSGTVSGLNREATPSALGPQMPARAGRLAGWRKAALGKVESWIHNFNIGLWAAELSWGEAQGKARCFSVGISQTWFFALFLWGDGK